MDCSINTVLKIKLTNISTPLSYSGITLPILDTTKFLGLHFSSNHSWLTHIKHIKAKALRTINILKYISHPSTGYNRKILLPLHKSLIQPILDFGSPIYGLAPKSSLKLLDSA